MSTKELSAPAPPPSFITPDQGRVPSPSNSLSVEPIIDSPPVKKTGSKTSKIKVSKQDGAAEQIDPPARQRARYEPYRKAEPTPEREAALPADPEDLETLDATAKTLYKSDREVLEYVETLKRRAAAISEHVNRTSSQLRARKDVMERIELYMAQLEGIEDRRTRKQLFGDGNPGEERVGDKTEVLGPDDSSDGHPPFIEA